MPNRRIFLQSTVACFAAGLSAACRHDSQPKPASALRFAVASDGHLGEPNTPSDQYYRDLLNALSQEHQTLPLDFIVINGDLVHQDSTALLPNAKAYLDQLPVPYFVTRGNHDRVSVATWQQLWGYPTNHVVERPNATLLLLDTSNEAGDYLCGDDAWLRQTMATVRPALPVFLFMHIPFIHSATGTDACGAIMKVLTDFPAIRAVFHGHDHTKDLSIFFEKTALLFDAHFGSSWGTPYRGYRIVESDSDSFNTHQYDFVNRQTINHFSF